VSGLIFAGLGKGIADAGATFGNAMMRDYELTRQDALAALRDERLGKREEARDVRTAQRAEDASIRVEDRKEAAAMRDANISAAAEDAAPGIGEDRRFAKFQKDLGATEMPEEQLRQVFDQQYDQRKVGDFAGAERYSERYSKQREDVLNEIRRTGGSSGLINSARDSQKLAVDAEKTSDRLNFEDRRLQEQETRRREEFNRELPIKQQSANAATSRAANTGDGGVQKIRSTYTNNKGERIGVMSDGSSRVIGQGMEFDKQISDLITTMSKNDYAFNKLPEDEKRIKAIERFTGGAARTPAPAAASTPGTVKNYSNLWK
jgi:hypothetical protein